MVVGLNGSARSGFVSRAIAVVAFGVAFGFMEAAAVAYLRSAIGLGSVAPAQVSAALGTFETVEGIREAATLVMIAAIGWLAGRSGLERLAWAAVVFGLWDIVYYVGLRLATGWPPSLETWDVLFLLPSPWVGPVWAPIVVSAALIGFGMTAAGLLSAGWQVAVGPFRAVAALAGGGMVIASFLVDAPGVMAGQVTAWTGGALFWAGMALAASATASTLVGRPTTAARPALHLQHGTGGRPSAGSPD